MSGVNAAFDRPTGVIPTANNTGTQSSQLARFSIRDKLLMFGVFFGSLPVNPGHSSGILFDIRRWHSHELVLNWIKTKRASSAHMHASLWLAGVSLTAKQGLSRILISEWKCWVMASLISVQRVSLFPAFPMFYTPNASWKGFEIQ